MEDAAINIWIIVATLIPGAAAYIIGRMGIS
jgi:hypothetical protein